MLSWAFLVCIAVELPEANVLRCLIALLKLLGRRNRLR